MATDRYWAPSGIVKTVCDTARDGEAEPSRSPGCSTAVIPLRNGKPEVTNEMKKECIGEFAFTVSAECGECLDLGAQSDCETCGGEIVYKRPVMVPWDTCKEIYKRMARAAMRR